MYKNMTVELSEMHLATINECWRQVTFLSWCGKRPTTAIKKTGDRDFTNTGSCRPISRLFTLGKLYESVTANILIPHLENGELLSDRQYEFHPRRSTTDAVERLVRWVRDGKATHVMALFLDLWCFP